MHSIWYMGVSKKKVLVQIVGLFFFRTPTKGTPNLWKPPYVRKGLKLYACSMLILKPFAT